MKRRISLISIILLYIVAGINHFLNPQFYLNIMPAYFPAPVTLVNLSGICEIVSGLLLCFKPTRKTGAWLIVVMLVVFFTVHIDMIIKSYPARGKLFWISVLRFPLQFVLISWAYHIRNITFRTLPKGNGIS